MLRPSREEVFDHLCVAERLRQRFRRAGGPDERVHPGFGNIGKLVPRTVRYLYRSILVFHNQLEEHHRSYRHQKAGVIVF